MVDNHLIQRDRNRTYSVSNRGTQLIVCNSCDNSLNAYGISVYAKSVILLHILHL